MVVTVIILFILISGLLLRDINKKDWFWVGAMAACLILDLLVLFGVLG